jgi:hypothetical protein
VKQPPRRESFQSNFYPSQGLPACHKSDCLAAGGRFLI